MSGIKKTKETFNRAKLARENIEKRIRELKPSFVESLIGQLLLADRIRSSLEVCAEGWSWDKKRLSNYVFEEKDVLDDSGISFANPLNEIIRSIQVDIVNFVDVNAAN